MAAAIGLTVAYGIGIQKVYSVIDTFNPKDSKENATSNSSRNGPAISVNALPSPCFDCKGNETNGTFDKNQNQGMNDDIPAKTQVK